PRVVLDQPDPEDRERHEPAAREHAGHEQARDRSRVVRGPRPTLERLADHPLNEPSGGRPSPAEHRQPCEEEERQRNDEHDQVEIPQQAEGRRLSLRVRVAGGALRWGRHRRAGGMGRQRVSRLSQWRGVRGAGGSFIGAPTGVRKPTRAGYLVTTLWRLPRGVWNAPSGPPGVRVWARDLPPD